MPFLKGIIGIIQMISKTDFIGAMVLRECGSKLIHVKSRIVCLAYGRSRCVHRRSEGACLYTATKRAGICMDCPKNNWQIHSNYKTNKVLALYVLFHCLQPLRFVRCFDYGERYK